MTTAAATSPAAFDHFRLPPGPRSPRLVNGAVFMFARGRLMRTLQERYGDAYTVHLPVIGRTVVVSSPELIKAVYTAPPDVLIGGANPLGKVLGPGSLFSMDGDRHLAERRMLLRPFHGDRMRSYHGLIDEEAVAAMRSWPDDTPFPTIRTFNKITLRVILRAVFGAEGAELAQLEKLLPRFTALGQRAVTAPIFRRDLGRFSPGRRFVRMRAEYDALVGRLIEGHLNDPALGDRIDILAMMLQSLSENGGQIDRAAVSDELLTLLVAGHETTASSLAWTVERLRRHPAVLRRLEEELEGGGSEYRIATINEVHRVRPVIGGTGRVADKPFDLGEWRLPPGSALMPAATAVHGDERWHEDAHTFDPDRYVGKKPDTYAWIPFGGGMRRCIGAAFAQMEMDVVLSALLRDFELVPTRDRGEAQSFRGVAFAPAKGGVAVVRRRAVRLGS